MPTEETSWRGERLGYRVEDEILEVELFAEPLNEIGLPMLVELERLAAFVRAGAGGARAMVIASANEKGFSAGADLRELHAGLSSVRMNGGGPREALKSLAGHAARLFDSPVTATLAASAAIEHAIEGDTLDWRRAAKLWGVRAFIDRIHAVFDTFDTAPFPTVAAVHGVCFGGGFELALTCDVIVADKSARFAFPELRLGLVPGFGGIPRLERDLGNAVVRDLLLSGRSLGAQRAHEVGLVAQLVGAGHAKKSALRLAKQMTKFDARTAAAAKRFIKPFPAARLEEEKRLFCALLTSPVVEEALEAFVTSDDAQPYLPVKKKDFTAESQRAQRGKDR